MKSDIFFRKGDLFRILDPFKYIYLKSSLVCQQVELSDPSTVLSLKSLPNYHFFLLINFTLSIFPIKY